MSYVARVLQPGEAIEHTAKLHWFIYLRTIFALIICIILIGVSFTRDNQNLDLVLGIAVIIFGLLGLLTGVRAFIRRATTELAVTDRRVIYKTGLLSRHTIEMNRDKVESVDVDQTVSGRIFGYGTIVVRGTGGSLEPIRNIGDPLTFRSYITAGPASGQART
jgi:uncharacterized membrane protein YdbT with pleckstrin-like domain